MLNWWTFFSLVFFCSGWRIHRFWRKQLRWNWCLGKVANERWKKKRKSVQKSRKKTFFFRAIAFSHSMPFRTIWMVYIERCDRHLEIIQIICKVFYFTVAIISRNFKIMRWKFSFRNIDDKSSIADKYSSNNNKKFK